MFQKVLDQFAGLLLAAILLAVIAVFIVNAQPSKPKPELAGAVHPTPTSAQVSTINGTVTLNCSHKPCAQDFAAFDVAAFATNHPSPVAQASIDSSGHFTLRVPAGSYTVKTIPESGDSISVSTNSQTPTMVTMHINIENKSP